MRTEKGIASASSNSTSLQGGGTKTKSAKDEIYIRVGGGCALGINPDDVVKGKHKSTMSNSFNYQIDSWGYALPDLGGITQQSVAGFMQTGSAGGSNQYTFSDAIQVIEFMNSKGEVIKELIRV